MDKKICQWRCCKKEFTPNKSFQKFCKPNCRHAANVATKRIRNKQKAVDYLGGKCSRCGYNKSLKALSFHHLNGGAQKDFTLAQGLSQNTKSWATIQTELDKCELLCANCHMEEHDINIS